MQSTPTPAVPGASPFKRQIAWPMAVLTSLFFMWGFMTVMNDVLVPRWKQEFNLTYWESTLVAWCFFGAYFVGSFFYWLGSMVGMDPIARIGYRKGAVLGLLLSALGCGLFVPASEVHTFAAFLGALFVLGLGFTLLQISANPFVAVIGSEDGASSRLNLAQAFNSLGTTLAPIIGGWIVLDRVKDMSSLSTSYLVYCGIFLVLAAILWVTPLPEPATVAAGGGRAWRHPHLRFGMLAIFCYVGAEVAIGVLFINFAKLPGVLGMDGALAKYYLSLYWGGAMCGRFLGALALSPRLQGPWRPVLIIGLGAALFLLLLAIQHLTGGLGPHELLPMLALVLANAVAFAVVGRSTPATLGFFACIALMLCASAMTTHGSWALWSLLAIGLFNSVMWSNIFTLAIEGLKDDTSQGSSLLVMMIVGGGVIPRLQGALADTDLGLQLSFGVPLLCYAYLAWYGFTSISSNPARQPTWPDQRTNLA